MIGKLTGRLDTAAAELALIDVNGVGYQVLCSARTLAALGPPGGEVVLHIETHVREDHIHLYGFLEPAEKEWFRLLQSVQGVGAKVALAILSSLSTSDLIGAVMTQDKAMISQAQGVGPKVAARIAAELKDKVGSLAQALPEMAAMRAGAGAPPVDDSGREAISALVNLGYRHGEAMTAVRSALRDLGADAELPDLIRSGLRELAK